MRNKNVLVSIVGLLVAVSLQAETVVIQDNFTGLGSWSYADIEGRMPEIGDDLWTGTLVPANSYTAMRAPVSSVVNQGASIALPAIYPGDIISIKAELGGTSFPTWWGLGFSDSSYVTGTLSENTPWAAFWPGGSAKAYGGFGEANSVGPLSRSGGAVSGIFDIEFICDTGAETMTTIFAGEVLHDNVPITASHMPSLGHAFINFRNSPGAGVYLRSFVVSIIPERQTGTIVWDDFSAVSSGENITASDPDVGFGLWTGSLVSDGVEFMRAPEPSVNGNDGGAIALPEFHPGDIISIKATIGHEDGAGWWGVGFSDAPYGISASMANNVPWATYRPDGKVNVFGGAGAVNSAGSLTRESGAVSGLFEVEFIYDTGASTVTTIFDKEVVHYKKDISLSKVPALDYAFIYFFDAESGGTSSGTYIDRLSVSVTPAALAHCNGTVVFWDDFDSGQEIRNSPPETDVESFGWDAGTTVARGIPIVNGALAGDANLFLYNGIALPPIGQYGVVSISAKYKTSAANANWFDFGFGDGIHRLTEGRTGPWVRIGGDGTFELYAGDGTDGLINSQSVSIPLNTFLEVKLTYDSYAKTVTTWFDGNMVHDGISVINSQGTPSLDYALLGIRYAPEVSVDDFVVEISPRKQPLLNLGEFVKTINIYPSGAEADVQNIRDALADATTNAVNGAVNVVFAPGTYILDDMSISNDEMFLLSGGDHIQISGNNATLEIRNPAAGFLRLGGCNDVIVENFRITYNPLPFTQGTVMRVDTNAVEIDLKIDAGYSNPTNSNFVNATAKWGWPINSSVAGRLRDYNELHHTYLNGIAKTVGTANTYTIPMEGNASLGAPRLGALQEGSRFAMLARYSGANILSAINGSENCTFKDIDIFAGPGITAQVQLGKFINFINVNNRFQGDNLIVSNGDGFHLQRARATWMENCLVQGLSDDLVNNYTPYSYVSVVNGFDYTLGRFSNGDFQVGDRLVFINPDGEALGGASVTAVNGNTVSLDANIAGVISSADATIGTHVYSEGSCAGLYVKNCDFRNSRRYGVLLRSSGSHVVGSSFCGLGSNAIMAQLHKGPGYEGGGVNDMLIMDNVFVNNGFDIRYQDAEYGYGVIATSLPGDSSVGIISSGLRIYRNDFSDWRTAVISLDRAKAVSVFMNTFNSSIVDSDVVENVVHDLTECTDVEIGLNDVGIREGDIYVKQESCMSIEIYD